MLIIKRINYEGASVELNTVHQIQYTVLDYLNNPSVFTQYRWQNANTTVVPGKATENYKRRKVLQTICHKNEEGDRAYTTLQRSNSFCKQEGVTNPCYELVTLVCGVVED